MVDEVLTLSSHTRSKCNFEPFEDHANDHPQLQHSQGSTSTVVSPIAEGHEGISAENEFRLGEPTFW
jgi:hypothetical protein